MPDVAPAATPASAPAPAPQGTGGTQGQPGQTGRAPNGQFTKPGQAPTPPVTEAAPTPPSKVKVKYKDDGKEFEEELSPEDIATRARQARWAQRSAQKAAQMEKDHQALQAALRDPKKLRALLKDYGHDFEQLSEQAVLEKYTPATLTPEQLEAYKAQQKLKETQDELSEYKTKEQQAAEAREVAQFRGQLDDTLGEIAKLGLVPKNPRALFRLSHIWEGMHDNGYQPTPQELGAELFNTYREDFSHLRGQKTGGELLSLVRELMGEDVGKELSRAYLAEYRAKQGQGGQTNGTTQRTQGGPPKPKPDGRRPGETFDEYFARRTGTD